MRRLHGVTVALATLFDHHDRVDYGAVRALIDFVLEAGVHGLYVCGTTGEFPLLTDDERRRLAEVAVEHAAGRAAVYVHVGHLTARAAARLARHAESVGAHGIGVVTPFYFSYSDDELFEYYSEIVRAVDAEFPVYLYNIPQRTTNALSPGLVGRLRTAFPNVIGLKDSSGSLKSIVEYMVALGERDFEIIQGADEQLLAGLALGCVGSISGNSNVFPWLLVRLWDCYQRGDLGEARRLQRQLSEIARVLGYGNVPILKEALRQLGIGTGRCRRPFREPPPATRARITEILEQVRRSAASHGSGVGCT